MKPEIVTAELHHIPRILAGIREADRDELFALYRQTPAEVLDASFRLSQMAWTGLVDGVPVCMFGVVKVSGAVGRPWMIGTTDLDRYAMIFLRRCKKQVEAMQRRFAHLENFVDIRNQKAIDWLRWLGFRFGKAELMGPFSLPFYRFIREG